MFHVPSFLFLFCSTEILCEVIDSSGLGDDLDTDEWTVFAPTNEAFEALPDGVVMALMNDTAALTDLLLYHAVPGVAINSTDLVCDDMVEMANGDLTQTVCENNTVFLVGDGNLESNYPEIIVADIEACNGMVHVISEVLL